LKTFPINLKCGGVLIYFANQFLFILLLAGLPAFPMAKKTFEDSLKKLEEITRELEDGDLSLEASLKKFEEGMALSDFCNSKLNDAQKKVNILLKKDGKEELVPFD